MKIDFYRLKEVEGSLDNKPISANTLQTMLDTVITFGDAPFGLAPNNVMLAIQTLRELGIVIPDPEVEKPEARLLKS